MPASSRGPAAAVAFLVRGRLRERSRSGPPAYVM